jgi:hypothetical protein
MIRTSENTSEPVAILDNSPVEGPAIMVVNEAVRPFLVPQTHTIRQAMEQLEKN